MENSIGLLSSMVGLRVCFLLRKTTLSLQLQPFKCLRLETSWDAPCSFEIHFLRLQFLNHAEKVLQEDHVRLYRPNVLCSKPLEVVRNTTNE